MPKTIITWCLIFLLALFFFYVGYKKLSANEITAGHFRQWGYSSWLLITIGLLEISGAVLLLFPSTSTSGAFLLSLIMAGASYTLIEHNLWKTLPVTCTALALLLLAGYLRWSQSWILVVFKM
jgi:uncharacterized membrane protein YphA (DoxX/SURF4 family)